MQLRSYQQGAIDCVEDPFNGILVLPTGSGKSVVIAGLAQKYNEPILILQPSKEILEQNYSKIISFVENPDEVGIFSASLNQKTIKRITLATIGSIKNKEDFSQFKIVIIDECHLVNAKSGMYSRLLKFLSPKMLIGLTATPYRMHVDDYNGVTWKFLHRTRPKIFSNIAYVYQNKTAFDEGFLVKPKYYIADYDTSDDYDTSSLGKNTTGADYSEDSVLKYNQAKGVHDKIIQAVTKNSVYRKHILVFTTSVQEAEIISYKLHQAGVESKEISSKNTKREREQILKSFMSGEIRVVVNVGVLTTGFDFPALDCVIGARPTMSLGLYYQMIGRGVRKSPGKDSWDYFDLCANVKTFGKVETYTIQGVGSKTSLKNETSYLIHSSDFNVAKKHRRSTDEGGDLVLRFGKYKDWKIKDVDTGYLEFCLKNFHNFSWKKDFEEELKRRA